jgi:hypothetical protein
MKHKSNLDEFSFASAIVTCQSITYLDLTACSFIDTNVLVSISKLSSLYTLILNECKNIQTNGLYSLSLCNNLHHIELHGCNQLDDRAIALLLDGVLIDTLEYLDISNCYMITDESIIEHITKCISIKSLFIDGCSKLTMNSIHAVCANLKMLTEFSFSCHNNLFSVSKKSSLPTNVTLNLQMLKITNIKNHQAAKILNSFFRMMDNNALHDIQIINVSGLIWNEEILQDEIKKFTQIQQVQCTLSNDDDDDESVSKMYKTKTDIKNWWTKNFLKLYKYNE